MLKSKVLKNLICSGIILSISLSLAACGSGNGGSSSSGGNSSSGKTSSSSSSKSLVWALSEEPQTLDPTINSASSGSIVIRSCFIGLTRMDENGEAIPGAIEEMPTVSEDNLTYTFKLKKDAKWSDGKSVTANDYIYSFLRALNSDAASSNAVFLYPILNAQDYNEGKKSKEDVGLKAVDDYTLEIKLHDPTPYFLQLLTKAAYSPLREDMVGSDIKSTEWARDPEKYICNGPYKLKQWDDKDKIVMVKNENWYDAANVKIEEIEFKIIGEASTALAAYTNGEIDYMEGPPPTEISGLKNEGICHTYPLIGTYYLEVNQGEKLKTANSAAYDVLQNEKVKQALSLAIDRQELVEKVYLGGQKPAISFVPYGTLDDKGNEFATNEYAKYDVEEAKKLLSEAGFPDGKDFPKIRYRFWTNELAKSVAEAIQDMWKKNLNIEVELVNEEFKVYLDTLRNEDFEIGYMGYLGDYPDPNTLLELQLSNNPGNDSKYVSEEYDKLINDASKESDFSKRTQILRDAEALLMKDMPVIPICYYARNAVYDDSKLKNFYMTSTGLYYFDLMDIEK